MKKYRQKHLQGKIKSLKPKKSIFKKRWFWVLTLFGLLIIGVFYITFFFPALQIRAVQISGNEKLATQDIEVSAWQTINKKFLGFSLKNIFMVNTNTLKHQLLASFVGIEEVKIQKTGLNGLHIEITERKPVAIFCQDNNCFFIDKNGIIYESADSPGNNLIVRQSGETEPVIGQLVVDKYIIETIVKIQQNLKDNFQIEIREALYSNPLVITTKENWKIYFNPEADINLQIAKLNALLKNQISSSARRNLQYIYLQYKDRAYYK